MFEVLIVSVLVLWSSVVVFKKVLPQTSNSVFSKLSDASARKGWSTMSKWLKPKASGGCGGNCACPVNDEVESKANQSQTVKWK